MTYGYIRVSTDRQTVENQRFEINAFCKRQNLAIDGWIEETISGTKNYDKRKLGELLKTVKKDDSDEDRMEGLLCPTEFIEFIYAVIYIIV